MPRKKADPRVILSEIEQIHELVEIDNSALDEHVLDYCNPLLDIMRRHVDDKVNHLKKYATFLQKLSSDDVGTASIDAILTELDSIKTELAESLRGALRYEGEHSLNPREQMDHFLKISSICLLDMINRLQRIQKVLHSTLSDIKQMYGS